jgi:hypothetical protein
LEKEQIFLYILVDLLLLSITSNILLYIYEKWQIQFNDINSSTYRDEFIL